MRRSARERKRTKLHEGVERWGDDNESSEFDSSALDDDDEEEEAEKERERKRKAEEREKRNQARERRRQESSSSSSSSSSSNNNFSSKEIISPLVGEGWGEDSKWLNRTVQSYSNYVPQVGDKVVYFKQGHLKFLNAYLNTLIQNPQGVVVGELLPEAVRPRGASPEIVCTVIGASASIPPSFPHPHIQHARKHQHAVVTRTLTCNHRHPISKRIMRNECHDSSRV